MAAALRRLAMVLVLFGMVAGPAFSQDTPPAFKFGLDLGLGVQTFNDPDTTVSPTASTTTYQSLSLSPDFSIGNFGIGLALTLNYRFAGTGSTFMVRQLDWIPAQVTFQNVLALYLAKIAYVRWGQKGDPLFLKAGSFDDATLGDGFIMGDYSNMLFLPGDRHFGLQADLDGNLFTFPYLGFESAIGNLGQFDVVGARLYVRPLASLPVPIINNLQVGATVAADTNPYLEVPTLPAGAPATASPVAVFGADIQLPIVNVKDVVSLTTFTDVASIQGTRWGGMVGFGGKLIDVFTYGAQLRLLGENFIPVYFGPTYDLLRAQQFVIVQSGTQYTPSLVGWLATLGTSFLDDKFIFRVSLDGPFVAPTTDPTGLLSYPHMRAIFSLAEGVVPVFSFDFTYDKKGIAGWADFLSPNNAAFQAKVNFKTGPAVISFFYQVIANQPPISGLQTSISLF
jgi:hypothetical protein